MKSIRGLAIAALAAAALVAVPASASAFGGFVADDYTATLQDSGSVEFQAVYYSGTCSGISLEASLKDEASSLSSSSLGNSSCQYGSLEMKGCQFEFHPGSGTTRIGPSGCGPAKFTLTSCFGVPMYVASQDLDTKFENFGSGSEAGIHAVIEDLSVKYTTTSNPCKGTGEFEDLAVKFVFDLTATDEAEKAIGTSLVSGGTGEIGLSAESSGGEPRLEGELYPVQVGGERLHLGETKAPLTLLENPKGKGVACEAVQVDGGELSGPAHDEFNLDTAFSGCKFIGTTVSVTVEMNSCHYAYTELQSGKEADLEGTAAVVCAEKGDVIKLSGPGCSITISGQTLSNPAGLSTLDVEFFPNWTEVGVITSGTGVSYTVSGAFCGLVPIEVGSFENGSLETDFLLQGMRPS